MADDRTHIGQKLRCLQHCGLYHRTIELTCPRCRAVRRFDAAALWWMFERKGWDDRIEHVARHFYCQACRRVGRVARPRVMISRAKPDPDQPPYPDQATWNRVKSRYRS